MEKKRKQIVEIFKKVGLLITIKMSLHVADFLDIQFNLKRNSSKPYMKSNSVPIFVNKNSNHPPQVLKELPKTIEKWNSIISSSKEIFDNSKTLYEYILKLSNQKNIFRSDDEHQEKKKRKGNAICYNPPYSINMKTNIGKLCFKLLHTHFPKTDKFYRIFNQKQC